MNAKSLLFSLPFLLASCGGTPSEVTASESESASEAPFSDLLDFSKENERLLLLDKDADKSLLEYGKEETHYLPVARKDNANFLFSYSEIGESVDGFLTLQEDSFFMNPYTDGGNHNALPGIKNVIANYHGEGKLYLDYGWAEPDYQEGILLTSGESFAFFDQDPPYFRLRASGEVDLISLSVRFTGKVGTDKGQRNISFSPKEGGEIELQSDAVKNLSSSYSLGKAKAYYGAGESLAGPGVDLSWSFEDTLATSYEISYGREPDLNEAQVVSLKGTSLHLDSLLTGETYYWEAKGYDGGGSLVDRTGVHSFLTKDGVRAPKVSGVSNFRDLGNGLSGNRIPQGKVFRSALLDSIASEGKEVIHALGIASELDLRNDNEVNGRTASPIEGLSYAHLSGRYYVGEGYGIDGDGMSQMKEELLYFADASHYPILVHCSLGRDRTGTLCFLLGALAGNEEEILSLDYELSHLSATVYEAEPSETKRQASLNAYSGLLSYLNSFEGDTLQRKAEAYCLSAGLTQSEIQRIETNLHS